MKNNKNRVHCFCAFCKKQRKYYSQKSLNLFELFICLLLGFGTAFLIKQEFDFQFILFFFVYLVLAEVFVLIRWRMHLVCPHCGFDPALYMKNNELAAEKVKGFLEKRIGSADFILKDPLHLPRMEKKKVDQIRELSKQAENLQVSKSGQLLSKQV